MLTVPEELVRRMEMGLDAPQKKRDEHGPFHHHELSEKKSNSADLADMCYNACEISFLTGSGRIAKPSLYFAPLRALPS